MMPVPALVTRGIMEQREERNNRDLVIDSVLTAQPELGPSVPEGGYGWVVVGISQFFQLLIPSLLVSFGIFLSFSRMKISTMENQDPKLWDHKMLYVPLFFTASWTFFDPSSRQLITYSTWPKLFAVAGVCLTCAGLLFLWMGMTGQNTTWLFVLSGIITGVGGSIQMSQCEILLAQYFRLKLPLVTHIGHACAALGFIIAPMILGAHLLVDSETHVLLWYQALILQGLVLNLFLRKPIYMKSKGRANRYNHVTSSPDDEEDIFSKNSRELQIKVQRSSGSEFETHELPQSSQASGSKTPEEPLPKDWVTFDEDEEEDGVEETTKYERVPQWNESSSANQPRKWETFEDGPQRNSKNLHLEMSFGDALERPTTQAISGVPIPLFSDTPVNNNTSYSYDALEEAPEALNASVFMPATPLGVPTTRFAMTDVKQLLRTPTFYKSLLTIITIKWSLFVFFSLFPSFLLQETEMPLRHMSNIIGIISVTSLLFTGFSYWMNVEKKWRAKMVWFLSWFGALGYFMISDYFNEELLLFGAVQIVMSISALQHVGTPLLGLTVRGEPTKEYTLISMITGVTLLFFVVIDVSFKYIFRMMALLNFLTGSLWLANYLYKRMRIR
ncbi:uncharacterized protein [Euwallacea fornicatus]|uniref:uncharacterized protein isoform X2 n=1 Tax=Euwallacea fornicatus TaxID=995702 RepID=UPI00338F65FC